MLPLRHIFLDNCFMNTLPEFIKGIATAKDNASIARSREFVIKTYKLLLGKLANQKKSKGLVGLLIF